MQQKTGYFKTSHVIVYRSEFRLDRLDESISKHLMLLFINGLEIIIDTESGFQNISCYCLSEAVVGYCGFVY